MGRRMRRRIERKVKRGVEKEMGGRWMDVIGVVCVFDE